MAHPDMYKDVSDMRTNFDLDETLLQEVLTLSGVKTEKDVISLALQEFVLSRKHLNLIELAGKIKFSEDYEYKTGRQSR